MKKLYKWIIAAVILTAIVAAAAVSAMQPVKVDASPVSPALWEQTFTEKGEAVAKDPVKVYSKSGGLVKHAFYKDGDLAEAGNTLFEFDTDELQLQRLQLENELSELLGRKKQASEDREHAQGQLDAQVYAVQTQRATARSQIAPLEVQKVQQIKTLDSFKKTLEDARVLFELGEVARTALDEAQRALDAQQSAIDGLDAQIASLYAQIDALNIQEANLRSSTREDTSGEASSFSAQESVIRLNIEDIARKIAECGVKSPARGEVRSPVSDGETVQPGALLAEIITPGKLEIQCYLQLEDLGSVSEGDAVEAVLRRRSGDISMEARVTEIGSEAVERISPLGLAEKRVCVKLSLSEGDIARLGPGYGLDVIFKTERIEDCIFVPKTAVFRTETGFAVWVIENGEAKSRAVVRGSESPASVVIASGLKAGDVVVLDAEQHELKEGMKLAAA